MASQTINARSEIDTSKMRIDPHSAMSDTHVPTYCLPEFGKDGVVKGELKDGYFVPAGAMLPLGAGIQAGTILKYGGYFPAGTAFPKGVIVPLHARMVNVLPAETIDPPAIQREEICVIM
ncbi:hypothetical protein HD553DRAFT_67389 [Filobasidium floriforme]|uniref:uncharacterized protein n=1 Tax=Filobasidium floriforme TaxID=5210 RepID=UPI001E8E4B0B|nr:uncharacterized protein HD553DRAFT_67389 [Filobasidium floriforme]KAH8082197.1 hypothetical protein HD553DRAFT_67389 [Filobasidium floriforme]